MTLIGSNGAGKSTTLRSISGLTPPAQGSIRFDGRGDHGDRAAGHRAARHLPVTRGPPLLPADVRPGEPRPGRLPAPRRQAWQGDLDRVFELFPRLKERERQKAGTMSGGEQQMLAIGRALMADPKLLLLDEPSMGIAPILVERIYETIAEINRQGTTILLVEQNANFALGVSKRGYVLETGQRSRSATSRRRCATTPRSRGPTWAHDRHRRHGRHRPLPHSTRGSPRRSSPRTSRTGRATARSPGLRRASSSASSACWSGSSGRRSPDSRWKLAGRLRQRRQDRGRGARGARRARAGREAVDEHQPLLPAARVRPGLRRPVDRGRHGGASRGRRAGRALPRPGVRGGARGRRLHGGPAHPRRGGHAQPLRGRAHDHRRDLRVLRPAAVRAVPVRSGLSRLRRRPGR